MNRAQAYLAKAAECEHAALSADDPKKRATYWDLAKRWRELAAQAEALEGKREPRD